MSAAQPLTGIRVLDLCVVFAGPFATKILAELGAEVIKIESRQHYPSATKGPRSYPTKILHKLPNNLRGFPDNNPGARPWERASRVHVASRNKLSMTVDLERPEGRAVFLDLVERSHIVMENNSPRLLENLGLTFDELRKRNPAIVLVRMPALGLTGDGALAGVGSNFEALVGLSSFRGYPDIEPSRKQSTYRMDAATGPMGALAAMAALRQARHSGDGREVVVSQATNLLNHEADVLIEAQLTGRNPVPQGNRHPDMVPHGCYRAFGDDRWVVIACRDDDDWRRLSALVAEPPPVDERANATTRRAAEDAIDEWLENWTSVLEAPEVERRCVAAGVPAAMVRRESDKFTDRYFRLRQWFLTMDHPEVGRRDHPGFLWRTSAGQLAAWRVSPTLGEDNEYVYRDVLGYSDARVEELRRAGHIGTTYLFEETDSEGKR